MAGSEQVGQSCEVSEGTVVFGGDRYVGGDWVSEVWSVLLPLSLCVPEPPTEGQGHWRLSDTLLSASALYQLRERV